MIARYWMVVWSAATVCFGAPAYAQTPVGTSLTYQAELRASGQPAAGPVDLRFRLYDAVSLGTQIGVTIDRPNVALAQGRFTQDLDFGAGAFGPDARFLEIEVRSPAGAGAYVMLSPRQRVTPSPVAQFSVQAGNAATATTATQLNGQGAAFYTNAGNLTGTLPGTTLGGTYSGALTFSNAGNAFTGAFAGSGAGLMSVNADLLDGLDSSVFLQSIPVPLTLSGASLTHIIRGQNASDVFDATGVYGLSTGGFGITHGVFGRSDSSSGRGVNGVAAAGFGTTFGGHFVSSSTSGRGAFGLADAFTGETYGVWGESNSTDGVGVFGWAQAGSGSTYGVFGQSNSTDGRGVWAAAAAPSGFTYGVDGWSGSTSGTGVRGRANAASGGTFGVYGLSSSTDGLGVYGLASATSGATAGVLGEAFSPNGWAVYAAGRFGAGGTKSFRIDHPLDPENKWLLHYCSESPEPQNFYNGQVVTDADGYAWVELPGYFGAVNRDFKYQLTVVDDADADVFVLAKISKAIRDNRFQIRTSAPHTEVSWRVDAVRNDRWVQKYGAPVQPEKEGRERGKYQHPDLFGQPPEKGMNYDPAHAERRAADRPRERPAHEADRVPVQIGRERE